LIHLCFCWHQAHNPRLPNDLVVGSEITLTVKASGWSSKSAGKFFAENQELRDVNTPPMDIGHDHIVARLEEALKSCVHYFSENGEFCFGYEPAFVQILQAFLANACSTVRPVLV
jgi:hypothetical protein